MLSLLHAHFKEGGAEKVAVDLALSLDRTRYEPSFCALKATPNQVTHPTREAELRETGLSYFSLNRETVKDPRGLVALVRLLRRERIDIVHAHLWDANILASLAKPLARTPVVVAHEHTWSFEGNRMRVATDRHIIARFASIIACVSEDDRRKMIEVEKIPADRIRLLPNGIPPLRPLLGTDIRAEAGIPAGARLVGVVAVARRQKRLDVLIQAIARMTDDVPDVHVVIAGWGGPTGQRPALEQLAASLGILDRVHFLGLRRDISDVLAAIDVACLSSDFEGQPLSVLEYMAAGKPIVCTNVGGLAEMLHDGVEGILVPRRDPDALAAALTRVLLDRNAAEAMGAAAKQRQLREFSLDAAVKRIEALYEELWERTGRERR